MKKIIIFLFLLLIVQLSFGQFVRMLKRDKWKVNKEAFAQGDTLTFTLLNKRRGNTYYYKDADYYTLYKIVNGKEGLAEDTVFRGIKEPVLLKYKETITVKKVVTAPGTYFMRYDIFVEQDKKQKFRMAMQQQFTIKMQP